jgi:hypothetical protein
MVDVIWTPKEMPKERHIVIRNTARHICRTKYRAE